MKVLEIHETRWVVPIGYRKITKEGPSYKIYLPKQLAEKLLRHGLQQVFVYIEAPKEAFQDEAVGWLKNKN